MANNTIALKPEEELLTTGEAARMLRVEPPTIARWCRQGKLWCTRTPGGHRRVRKLDMLKIVSGEMKLGRR